MTLQALKIMIQWGNRVPKYVHQSFAQFYQKNESTYRKRNSGEITAATLKEMLRDFGLEQSKMNDKHSAK